MITQDRVKEVFKYVQGNLYWRINLGTRAKIGVKAGNINKGGYRNVQVDGKQYYIHRLIYLYHHGYMPKYIDHKNGKYIGDYIWNLRECTAIQNIANSVLGKNNTSGFKGVGWCKSVGKWYAKITFCGKVHYLGYYEDPSVAGKIVDDKRKELHGKFYRRC